MHGRKKLALTDIDSSLLEKKKVAYSKLLTNILSDRHDLTSLEVLNNTTKLLKQNPDVYTAWNIRREILIALYNQTFSLAIEIPDLKINAREGEIVRNEELSLTAAGILKNPKSYNAWFHRVWILDRFEIDITNELELCKTFLTSDQRNFHCWNYRRYVVSASKSSLPDELRFSMDKIEENFSNYSAFHHRSVYVKEMNIAPREHAPIEFALVENAIYTEPDDQSAWWYHQFLLRWIVSASNENNHWISELLNQQIQIIEGLLALEPQNKWAMSSLASLIQIFIGYNNVHTVGRNKSDSDEVDLHSVITNNNSDLAQRRIELLTSLQVLDPIHSQRYKYLLSL